MRDLTDNRFLVRRNYFNQRLSLNDFIFGGCVVKQPATHADTLAAIRNLVASLGFSPALSGYDYLSRMVELYYIKDDYKERDAVSVLAEYYRVSDTNILANIAESFDANKEFLPRASFMLNMRLYRDDCLVVYDLVEIIAALFKIYYNYDVSDEQACTEEYERAINFYKAFKHAN